MYSAKDFECLGNNEKHCFVYTFYFIRIKQSIEYFFRSHFKSIVIKRKVDLNYCFVLYWSLSVVCETTYKQGLFIFSIYYYTNSSKSYDWYYRYKNNVFDLISIRSKRRNQPLKCLKQYLLRLNSFLFLQFSIKLSCVHIVTWIFQNTNVRCKYKFYGRLWSLFWIK